MSLLSEKEWEVGAHAALARRLASNHFNPPAAAKKTASVPVVYGSDRCVRCGRAGHYDNACQSASTVHGQPLPPLAKNTQSL